MREEALIVYCCEFEQQQKDSPSKKKIPFRLAAAVAVSDSEEEKEEEEYIKKKGKQRAQSLASLRFSCCSCFLFSLMNLEASLNSSLSQV